MRRLSRLNQLATVPAGEWLGSSADEGRAKLRKAYGSRMEAKNIGSPNGNPSQQLPCAIGNVGN
jgi:hypothetical protein